MQHFKFRGISSFTLHILAMTLMLCDHLWATLFPAQEWLTCIGRMAFPIFAFMIAEGYSHTSNVRNYIFRLFAFAIISEVPFNLIYGSSVIFPFHQNVLWTFLIALLSINLIEKNQDGQKKVVDLFGRHRNGIGRLSAGNNCNGRLFRCRSIDCFGILLFPRKKMVVLCRTIDMFSYYKSQYSWRILLFNFNCRI